MEILSTLGLEGKVFLAQLINFLIVVFILKKILYKPMQKMLNERKNKIEQGLHDAENAKIALENAGEEKKKIMLAAKNDADAYSSSVKRSMEDAKTQSAAAAKKQADQIVEDAKQKASMEFENLSKQIGTMSVNVSEKILTRVISGLFTDEEKQKLLSRAVEQIEKGGYEKNPD